MVVGYQHFRKPPYSDGDPDMGIAQPYLTHIYITSKLVYTTQLLILDPNLLNLSRYTLRKFNIAPENVPSQKESSLPTIFFQGLC